MRVKVENSEELNTSRSNAQSNMASVSHFRDLWSAMKDKVIIDTLASKMKWKKLKKRSEGSSRLLQCYTSLRVSMFEKWNRGMISEGDVDFSSSSSKSVKNFDTAKNLKRLAQFQRGEDVSDSDSGDDRDM